MIKQLNFVGLVVEDLDNAVDFFTKKLGLTVNSKMMEAGAFTAFALDGGAAFAVVAGIPDAPDLRVSTDLSFVVDDADKKYEQWKANGVEMVTPVHDMPFGRTFLFRTPDGHPLRAYQPVAS